MAELEKIREMIVAIAQKPNNVTLAEIDWVVSQLQQHHGYSVNVRTTRHSLLYRVNDQRFGVNIHNPGSKQVKTYSVKAFLEAMVELELYEG